MDFEKRLEDCNSIADVFELVKETVLKMTGQEQAGLMVGLSDLGKFPKGFVGAYYSPQANMIVINNRVLQQVKWNNPGLFNPYLFHIVLHEYIHSIGVYDEEQTRQLTSKIALNLGNQPIIELSTDMTKHFPEIVETDEMQLPEDQNIYFVKGIDRKNMNYIY